MINFVWTSLFLVMGQIRLYRQIYCFNAVNTSSETKTLINPDSISASTKTVSGSIVEVDITPVNESTGIYYVDLNPVLYSSDITYELNWYVSYVPGAPIKRLPTRFRISPKVVGNEIGVEIETGEFEIEILDNNIEINIG